MLCWSDVLSAHGHPHAAKISEQVAFVGNSHFLNPVWQDTVPVSPWTRLFTVTFCRLALRAAGYLSGLCDHGAW